MSRCTIDHSLEDVLTKLQDQKAFLPKELFEKCYRFLQNEKEQTLLNEIYHLLKKYDLSSEEERKKRNKGLEQYV